VAVKIRLMRVGKKKQPTYRVVVANGRSARDGRFIEIIGQYAPREDPSRIEINGDAALGWLRKGAQPTEPVQKLLTATGVWAQYETERGGSVTTKFSRRGFHSAPPVPKKDKGKAAPAAAVPVAAEPATAVEEAPEVPVAETEAPVVEAPAAEAEAPVESEAPVEPEAPVESEAPVEVEAGTDAEAAE
jgi:small subunit ribosomal protein S16